MPQLTVESIDLKSFAHAPSFGLGDDAALEEYTRNIDFDSVFSFVQKYLNFERRACMTPRALKLALPSIAVDHGGERIMQEVVQKIRQICRDNEDDDEFDIGLVDFKMRFESWLRPSKEKIRLQKQLKGYESMARDFQPVVRASVDAAIERPRKIQKKNQ